MKKFKRVLALVLALMLTFALVSCGDEGDKSESKADSSNSTNTSDDTSKTSDASDVSEDSSDISSDDTDADVSDDASNDVSSDASDDTSADASTDEPSDKPSDDPTDDNRPLAYATYGSPKVDVENIDPLWANATEYKGEKIRYSAATNSDKAIEDTYTRFTFKVMWDDTKLYVLIHVDDSTIGSFNEEWTWRNDAAEIFMSLDCSYADTYDYTYDGYVGIAPTEFTYGTESQLFGENLEYMELAAKEDAAGYYICASFDIASMNSDIAWDEGHVIGFEISVNDRVVDDERACCIAWADETDLTFKEPRLMGKVELVK